MIITIANHKGGVGKTATAQNLGAGLAKSGFRTLLIDLDAQANLSLSFGVSNPEKSIYEALRGDIEIPIYKIKENLSISPSSLNLAAIEAEMSSQAGRDFILKGLLEPIQSNYDFIVIDCPPSIGTLTINALTASDKVIIPTEAHYLSVQGIKKLCDVIGLVKKRLNKDLVISGVLITMYDKRTILQREIRQSVADTGYLPTFDTSIRNNVSIAEASYAGENIYDYAPTSIGASDYLAFVNEFLSKNNLIKNK